MLTNFKILLLTGYACFMLSMDGAVKHFYMRRGYWMSTDYLNRTILKMNQAIIQVPKSSFAYRCMVHMKTICMKRIAEFEAHNYKLAEEEE